MRINRDNGNEKSEIQGEGHCRQQAQGQTHLEQVQNILRGASVSKGMPLMTAATRTSIMRMVRLTYTAQHGDKHHSHIILCSPHHSLKGESIVSLKGESIVSLILWRRNSGLSDWYICSQGCSFLLAEPVFKPRLSHPQPLPLAALLWLLKWRRWKFSLKMMERQRTEDRMSQKGLVRTLPVERFWAASCRASFSEAGDWVEGRA